MYMDLATERDAKKAAKSKIKAIDSAELHFMAVAAGAPKPEPRPEPKRWMSWPELQVQRIAWHEQHGGIACTYHDVAWSNARYCSISSISSIVALSLSSHVR